MKKVLFGFLLFAQTMAFSQIEEWYGVDLSRLGYKNTTFTFENYPIGTNSTEPDEPETLINGGSFELSADFYKKHIYFNTDLSSLLDVGLTLFQFDKSKQRWFDNDEYFVLRSDILPTRLAFGSNIGKYLGIYLGGQYSLSSIGLEYKSNNSSLRNTRFGGHTYGFGGHLVAAYRFLNARYSYMYNWQSQGGGIFKGNVINNEFVLSFGFADYGLFTKFTHVYGMSNGGFLPVDRSRLFASDYEGADFSWQSSQYATQFQFSIGIYAAGLFSGVAKAGTKTIRDVEMGAAKERREEKRRKVEYKD
jgi:hypothetical protein